MPNTKPSRLWLARRRLGYEQKQIAELLSYRSIPQISRYETGQRVPSLKAALKLSIIYRLPVRVLFPQYFEECRDELRSRAKTLDKQLKVDLTEPSDYCAYIAMINASFLSDIDKRKVKRHILELMADRQKKILKH